MEQTDAQHASSCTDKMSPVPQKLNSVPIPELIRKKRDGEELSEEDIGQIVKKIVDGTMEPCQLGAFLMATYIMGLNKKETIALTRQMTAEGEVLSWPEEWRGVMVDKHSTGGVGDKTSILLAPALAACGLKVPMISGRGLGFTGGTLDKLESIEGFTVACSAEQMKKCLGDAGCCIVGQTASLVPADRLMYACRDVTATVQSLPLVTSSILSKKAAENLNCLVLDVKFGESALFKTEADATKLASSLVEVSCGLGIKTSAVLSAMYSPVGLCIGNAIEIVESLSGLHGNGHPDLMNLVYSLGGEILRLNGKVENIEDGRKKIKKVIDNGTAIEKFCQMLTFQGVNPEFAQKLCCKEANTREMLKIAEKETLLIHRGEAGYVKNIDGLIIATTLRKYGAGRFKSSDILKFGVGIELKVHVGEKIDKDSPWASFYHEGTSVSEVDLELLQKALHITSEQIPIERLNRVSRIISEP